MKRRMMSVHPIAWTIVLGTLFVRLASSMSMPFLAIYLTKAKGMSPALTGAIIGVSALIGIFGGFFGGTLSDKYGRRKIMLFAIALSVLVFTGLAVANSVAAFFLFNALNGMAKSFFEPSSRALLSDLTKKENRLFIFNLRYAAANIGVAIGPLIGLMAGSATSSKVFFVTAIVYMIYGIVLLIQLAKYDVTRKSPQASTKVTMIAAFEALRKDHVFLLAVLGIIFATIGYSQLTTTLPQYFANASTFTDGVAIFSYLLVLNAVTVLIVQYPVTRIGKYYSALVSIVLGAVTVAIGLMGIGMVHSFFAVAVCIIVFTIGEVMMFSMADVFVDELAPVHMKATYFGAMGFTNVGSSLGPWLGGILFLYFGYEHGRAVFMILGSICLISVPLLLVVRIMTMKRIQIEQGMEVDK